MTDKADKQGANKQPHAAHSDLIADEPAAGLPDPATNKEGGAAGVEGQNDPAPSPLERKVDTETLAVSEYDRSRDA